MTEPYGDEWDGVEEAVGRPQWVTWASIGGGAALLAVGAVLAVNAFGSAPAPAPTAAPTTATPVAPTAGPSPSGSPAPSLSPRPLAALVEGPGLPEAIVAPVGLLDTAGPGWVLAVVHPLWSDGKQDHVGSNVLYAISPAGESFQLLEFDPDIVVEVERWVSGTKIAVVAIGDRGAYGQSKNRQLALLDLEDGSTRAYEGSLPDSASYAGLSGGYAFWAAATPGDGAGAVYTENADNVAAYVGAGGNAYYPGAGAALRDPAGTKIFYADDDSYVILDVETGTAESYDVTVDDRFCRVMGWRTNNQLLAFCTDRYGETSGSELEPVSELRPVLYGLTVGSSISAGTSELWRGKAGEAFFYPGWSVQPVGGGAAVAEGARFGPKDSNVAVWSGCPTGAYLFDDGEWTRIVKPVASENIFTPWVANGDIYVAATSGCSGDSGAIRLVRYDVESGETATLVPRPKAGKNDHFSQTVVSWTVAE